MKDITDFVGVFISFMMFVIVPIFVAFRYKKQKSLALLLYTFGWWSMGFYFLFVLIVPNEFLFRMNEAFLPQSAMLFLLMFVDYSMKDSFDWKKLALSFVIYGISIGYLLNPATIVISINGTFLVIPSLFWLWLDNFIFMCTAIALTYWGIFLYIHVVKNLRKTASYLILGSIFLVLSVSFTTIYSMTNDETSSILSYAFLIVASASTSIIIYRNPSIVAVLPCDVYRIIVMTKSKRIGDNSGGTLLYEFNGTAHKIQTKLLASILTAFLNATMMFMNLVETDQSKPNDTLMAGMIREIKLDKATILVNSRHAVTFALLTSHSSINLTESFNKFVEKMINTYRDDLYENDGTSKVILKNTFSIITIDDMVKTSFPMFR